MDKKTFIFIQNSMSDKELAIREYAAKTHADVNQRYGEDNYPYFYHLDKVGRLVASFLPEILDDAEDVLPILFGAYFHDAIEDARLTYNDVKNIARKFMSENQAYLAAEIVYALTNEKGKNRAERANEKYYAGIRAIPYAPLVKACDRLANYNYAKEHKSSMLKAYIKEMNDFINHIKVDSEDKRFALPESLISILLTE